VLHTTRSRSAVWLARRPVKAEAAGSNPVGTAMASSQLEGHRVRSRPGAETCESDTNRRDGSTFIVCTAVQAPKVRALASNAKVALSIDTDTQPPHVLLVRGTATVEIVDGVSNEFLEASDKSLPRDQWPQFEAQVRSIYPQLARITIEPEWAKLLDFETRLPIAVEWLVSGGPRP
jgi:hypothetical protein